MNHGELGRGKHVCPDTCRDEKQMTSSVHGRRQSMGKVGWTSVLTERAAETIVFRSYLIVILSTYLTRSSQMIVIQPRCFPIFEVCRI